MERNSGSALGFSTRYEALQFAPVANHLRKRSQPALRMVYRALAAHRPEIWCEAQARKFRPTAPPDFPKTAHVGLRIGRQGMEIRLGEEAAHAEKQRLAILAVFQKQTQGEALRQEGEREFVAFISEDGGQGLIERFIGPVGLAEARQHGGFALEPILRRAEEHGSRAIFRQGAERGRASA